MRFILALFFFFFAYGFRQKAVQNFANVPQTSIHEHSSRSFHFSEVLEYILTGQIEHSHAHTDHEEDSPHEHSHQHSSFTTTSLVDIISENYQIGFSAHVSSWPRGNELDLAITFQSELLRPPIKA